jgi:hypothetical protein
MAVLVWRRQIICDTDVTLGIAPQLQRTNDTVGSRVTGDGLQKTEFGGPRGCGIADPWSLWRMTLLAALTDRHPQCCKHKLGSRLSAIEHVSEIAANFLIGRFDR